MTEANPYAPPQQQSVALSAPGSSDDFVIEGKALVVPKGTVLPDICVISGRPTTAPQRKVKLVFVPGWVYALLLINLLVVVIVALIVQKKGELSYSLSPEARSGYRKLLLGNWLMFLGSIASVIGAGVLDNGWLGLLALVLFVASIVVYFAKIRYLYAGKIDKERIWIRGLTPQVMEAMVAAAAAAR